MRMADNNKLYRIEVIAHNNLPEIDTMGMLLTNEGIAYVKLHPVQIKAKQKADEVVYCKDCKHYTEGMAVGMCKRDPQKPIMPMPYNNYCGFAERKDNGI